MKLLYFAWLREKTGITEEDVTLPSDVADVAQLIEWLRSRGEGFIAAFEDMKRVRVAVDQQHAQFDAPVKGASEIAFFPPVTGG